MGAAQLTGLASTALMAPAPDPATAIWPMVSSGYGEMIRLVTPYAVKSREFTAAMPSSGDAIPIAKGGRYQVHRFSEIWRAPTLVKRKESFLSHSLPKDIPSILEHARRTGLSSLVAERRVGSARSHLREFRIYRFERIKRLRQQYQQQDHRG